MITSGLTGAEEEARSAALAQDYQVLKTLSAGSFKPPSGQQRPALFPEACQVLLPACLGAGRSQGMIQPDGRLCFGSCDHTAHCTRTTPKPTRLPPGLPRTLRRGLALTYTHRGEPRTVPLAAHAATRPCTFRQHFTCYAGYAWLTFCYPAIQLQRLTSDRWL